MSNAKRAVSHLEMIMGRDVGRGIGPLVTASQGGLWSAASSIASHETPHVAILTGFYIPHADPPAPETDGPPGAATLAAALDRVGVSVRLVTDAPCASALRAAADAAGAGHVPFDVLPVDATASTGGAFDDVLGAWESASPPVSHVIALERVGPAADGVPHNARGDDISAHTAPLHKLFTPPRVTIGIGDGGNELGMGKLPAEVIADSVRHGERIACTVRCDHLLVCGVSNWGAWALISALALIRGDWLAPLMSRLTVEHERDVLQATVEKGPAVDGMLGRPELSVDHLPWKDNAAVLKAMLSAVR